MHEKIEPALSADDLRRIWRLRGEHTVALPAPNGPAWKADYRLRCREGYQHQLIAFANHLLPDSDPRKITRERLAAVRSEIIVADPENLRGTVPDQTLDQATARWEGVVAFLHALESYLPPADSP